MFFLNQKFLAGQNFIIYNEGSVIYTNTEFLSFSYKLPTYVVMIVNSQEHTYSLYSSIFVNYYSTNSLPLTKYTTFKNKFNFLFSNISYLISNSLDGCGGR